jgi:murein DD-endopeptidase MepM/ murein hydrolase activator NlpD
MPHEMLSRSRTLSRVAALSLIAGAVAGCSDSGRRFEISNPFASGRAQSQETTGSVAHHAAPATKVQAQPLPAPSRPQTVAASSGGVAQGGQSSGQASGGQGLAAYRPEHGEVTGSVAPRRVQPAAPAGRWTWEGGTPITVGAGETAEVIGRKYGVPTAAILQANHLTDPSQVKPGQRLVIPRYVTASAPPQPAAPAVAPAARTQMPPRPVAPVQASAPAKVSEVTHIVQPGESLMGIARHYKVPLKVLAKANKIEPYTKVAMGDRLVIPSAHAPAAQQTTAPRAEAPRTVTPPQTVASVPPQTTQSAQVATVEMPAHHEGAVKNAEPAGAIPSFRWPVRGRVISAFGSKSNGTQNDGINLAVPEGTPVKAAEDGVVAYAGNELKGYGNLVLVRHANGFVSAYANTSEIMVKRGDSVKRGQTIARAGQSGNVTSPQLHFEIRKGSVPVDPARYLGGA